MQIDSEKKADLKAYCCEVTAEKEGKEEVWQAKYVLVSAADPSYLSRVSQDKSQLTKCGRAATAPTPQSAKR
jgi:hypothetical protein